MQLISEKYNIKKSEDFEEIEFGLDEKSKALMIEMLHSNLYSNPIGSVVREVASNCIDAHTEAKITKPIEIEFRNKNKFTGDNQPSIIFRDYAGLLSPIRFKETYTKYFASTKRTDNQQVGGFGLGCKTPLAYTDSFNVHVIHEKIDYMYTVQKVEQGGIKLFLMHSEATVESNMTEVIVYLNNLEDKKLFIDEITKQLIYFKNIKFININITPIKIIEETKDFILSEFGCFSKTHLVIGNVPYKLDLTTLYPGYSSYNPSASGAEFDPFIGGFAIKFEIGELSLSINRESVYYTEATKKKIRTKIDLLCTSFSKEISDEIKNSKNVLDLVNTLSVIRNNGTSLHVSSDKLKIKSKFCLYSTSFKTFMYHGYPIDYGFSLFTLFSIRQVKESYQKGNLEITDLVNSGRYSSSHINFLTPVYYTEKGVLEKRKGLSEIRTIKSGFVFVKELTPVIDAFEFNKNFKTKHTQGDLQKYYDLIKAEIVANSKDWDAVQINLSLLDTDDQKAVMSSKEYRKINKLLFVKEIQYYSTPYDVYKRFPYKHSSVKSEELSKITEYVVYGTTEESDKLVTCAAVLHCIKEYTNNARVFKVAKENIDYFKDEKNMVPITEFFDVKSEPLKQFYTAYKLSRILKNYTYLMRLEKITSRIHTLYIKLSDYEKNNYAGMNFSSSIFTDILLFCETNNIQDNSIMAEAKEIIDFCEGLEILDYIDYPGSGNVIEEPFILEGICEILEFKKKEITYKIRPISKISEAKTKGKIAVMDELVKLQKLTVYDKKKNEWDTLKANFYIFPKDEYLHRVATWIEKL